MNALGRFAPSPRQIDVLQDRTAHILDIQYVVGTSCLNSLRAAHWSDALPRIETDLFGARRACFSTKISPPASARWWHKNTPQPLAPSSCRSNTRHTTGQANHFILHLITAKNCPLAYQVAPVSLSDAGEHRIARSRALIQSRMRTKMHGKIFPRGSGAAGAAERDPSEMKRNF